MTEALRVMLVDDTPDVRLLVRTLLETRPNLEVVAEAGDGEQAIALAAALRPDLIILDIAMPVLDGLSALPRLREVAPNARVVMLSAMPREQHEPAALAAGAAAYVEKSAASTDLVDEVMAAAALLDAAVRTLSTQIPALLGEVPAAREFVAAALTDWNETLVIDTVTLLLSELVTNAIVHAHAAPEVSVRLLPDRVHIEVTDSVTWPDQPDAWIGPTGGRGSKSSASGGRRGLVMVETLATAWGSATVPGGKVVWFDVARRAR